MNRGIAVFGLLALVTVARADYYLSREKTPKSVSLWVKDGSFFYDGNKLYELCKENGIPEFCRGYIMGVTDVVLNQNADHVCAPEHATVGQITDVVTKYLTDHPELRHKSGWSIVITALKQAFPC